MAKLSTSAVLREILTADLTLSADDVIKRARARGVTVPEAPLRALTHNVKSEVRRATGQAAPVAKPAPAAKPAAPKVAAKPAAKPTPAHAPKPIPVAARQTAAAPHGAGTLETVALVNKMVTACGGVANVRHLLDAVRACGGVDSFAAHLDLVATIRTAH